MNNKGYTLIELLAVFIIVAIVSSIAVIAYSSYINSSNNKVFAAYQETMHREASYYLSKNLNQLPTGSNKKTLSLSDIGIDPIQNPINSSDLCSESYVEVSRNDVGNVKALHYKVCLICSLSNFNSCKEYDY